MLSNFSWQLVTDVVSVDANKFSHSFSMFSPNIVRFALEVSVVRTFLRS
jgi:hypothetical protein